MVYGIVLPPLPVSESGPGILSAAALRIRSGVSPFIAANGRRFCRCLLVGCPSRAGPLRWRVRPLLSRRDRDRVSPEEAGKRMRHYEMMIILEPSLEERTVQPSLEQFLNVVTTGGGTVDKVDVWGRRRLAYQIDKKSEGIYTVIDMTAEPDTVKELDRQLNLNEAVLRTKIIRPDQR